MTWQVDGMGRNTCCCQPSDKVGPDPRTMPCTVDQENRTRSRSHSSDRGTLTRVAEKREAERAPARPLACRRCRAR